MNVVGWYFEDREDGRGQQLVIVQPSEEEGEHIEHVARTPAELWAAFEAIADDPELPDVETEVMHEPRAAAGDDDFAGMAVDAVESWVTQAGGPFIGRIVGGAIRNPDKALGILRSISRKDRR